MMKGKRQSSKWPTVSEFETSNRVSYLFWFGPGLPGFKKSPAGVTFFERSKSSGVPVTQPAGCGGKKMHLKE